VEGTMQEVFWIMDIWRKTKIRFGFEDTLYPHIQLATTLHWYLLSGFNTDVINSQLNITKQYFQQLSES
jgi:hypothetical protein